MYFSDSVQFCNLCHLAAMSLRQQLCYAGRDYWLDAGRFQPSHCGFEVGSRDGDLQDHSRLVLQGLPFDSLLADDVSLFP